MVDYSHNKTGTALFRFKYMSWYINFYSSMIILQSDDWVDATMILYNNRMSVTLFGGEVSSHPFHGMI